VKPDLEQQDDHAELREIVNHRIARIEKSENRLSEQNTRYELTHYGWLTQSLCDNAEQLRGDEQREEYDK
jgi:hypothetical protein